MDLALDPTTTSSPRAVRDHRRLESNAHKVPSAGWASAVYAMR
jgi:hypothetical protein